MLLLARKHLMNLWGCLHWISRIGNRFLTWSKFQERLNTTVLFWCDQISKNKLCPVFQHLRRARFYYISKKVSLENLLNIVAKNKLHAYKLNMQVCFFITKLSGKNIEKALLSRYQVWYFVMWTYITWIAQSLYL